MVWDGMGCTALTRNVFHFAAFFGYMAVKYTHIYFISVYCSRSAIYYITDVFTTQTVS
jgi:hypothetical protein